MKQTKVAFVFVLLLVLVSAVPFASAQKVKVIYDKDENFAQFKTYAWTTCTPVSSPTWNALIIDNIDSLLQQKGLQKVGDPKTADLLVNYHAAPQGGNLQLNAQPSDPTYAMYGGVPLPGDTPWSNGSINSSVAYYVQKGSLAVHVFDRQQHKLIWVATATGAVADNTQKKMKQLDKIMTEMFDKYPVK